MSRTFWDKEYRTSAHLKLSTEPAEDLVKFCRFMERRIGRKVLNVQGRALDLGCGNGRNLIYLAQAYGMRGIGYDISDIAIKQAKEASKDLPIQYESRSIAGDLALPDGAVNLVLDMMTSHFLKKEERETLLAEIVRVLRPGGWMFFKSFVKDGDQHVGRLLREHPADEEGAYVHPEIGVYEYVWSVDALREFLEPHFIIHKLSLSHKHIGKRGEAWKRRTVSAYLEKLG
jgi:SAM-dependent methyltransferase